MNPIFSRFLSIAFLFLILISCSNPAGTDETIVTPTPPPAINDIVEIRGGIDTTLFLTASGGLYGIGNNSFCQLGTEYPHLYTEEPLLITDDAISMDYGWYFTLYIDSEKQLWGCGKNEYGQLGVYEPLMVNTPRLIFDRAPVRKAVAGMNHILILTEGGELYAQGSNSRAQLGRETTLAYSADPILVATDVADCFADGDNSFYISNDGYYSLYGFGSNTTSQLGVDTSPEREVWEPVFMMDNAEDVSCNWNELNTSVFILKRDRTLYSCGRNHAGQLFQGSLTMSPYTSLEMAAEDIQSVQIYNFSAFVLKADGSLWSSGRNEFGIMGSPEWDKIYDEPRQIAADVGMFAVGKDYALIIMNDGERLLFGSDQFGQLGAGIAMHLAEVSQ